MYSSKEKHSLMRKLVGYRNWRQRWCKKGREQGFGEGEIFTNTLLYANQHLSFAILFKVFQVNAARMNEHLCT